MKKKILSLVFLLVSCATSPEKDDPRSSFNRDMLEFNLAVDRNVLRPVAITYKENTSDGVRESISNVLTNFKEPYYLLNYLVSFDAEHAANSLFRFVINSTLGFFGLFDVGSNIGLEKAETSYKDTLRNLDVSTGDYLVLPIFGFSSTRDAIAEPISWFCDPIGYILGFPIMLAKAVVFEVSNRAENSESMDRIIKESFDLYSVTRNMYFQKYGIKSPDKKDEFSDSPTPDDL